MLTLSVITQHRTDLIRRSLADEPEVGFLTIGSTLIRGSAADMDAVAAAASALAREIRARRQPATAASPAAE